MTTRPIRVLIVDDEPLARQRIEDLLARESNVKVVGTADNGAAAVEAIRALHPDLLFLDVQMPGKTGLEVARAIGPESMPATIFVTAYDQHALQAFDVAALDYLVKPFDDERFEQAFRRARRLVDLEETGRLHERLRTLLGEGTAAPETEPPSTTPATQPARYLDRIAVESKGKVRFVPVDEIDYIAASGPYAELVVGGRRHVIREAMQTLEERLDPNRFMRVHRSTIVRLSRVHTLLRGAGGDYEIQLEDGTRLRVSRSRRDELARRLGVR
ncbi:MAG TPA: LytTR family DNA-binding domain-containing protein [Gemmatimonadaceae bacterium]|nr:LytTR family DNA-binding domain-containing protein [Gemmatimonadaceae bacterium]